MTARRFRHAFAIRSRIIWKYTLRLATIVIQSWAENNGIRLSKRHFRTELRLEILELKGIVIIFHQFSKSKRILF